MTKPVTISKQQWLDTGYKLFGDDTYEWKFKCPACGHIQCADDFADFQDDGAKPDDAFKVCIGKFKKVAQRSGGLQPTSNGDRSCTYSADSLIDLCPLRVEGSSGLFSAFAFAGKEER